MRYEAEIDGEEQPDGRMIGAAYLDFEWDDEPLVRGQTFRQVDTSFEVLEVLPSFNEGFDAFLRMRRVSGPAQGDRPE